MTLPLINILSGVSAEETKVRDSFQQKIEQPLDQPIMNSIHEKESLLRGAGHLEAQDTQPATVPAERRTTLKTKLLFLGSYFLLNLGLTISNKAVLGKARFPWLLTTLHASATSIGCFAMVGSGYLKIKRLTSYESFTLVAFSFLFTLNIAISNVSLAAVSVPFHQIMRSTCPIVTIVIYRIAYSRTYSTKTYLSMIPLIFGVGLATAGDYYATLAGVILTAAGVVLASIKTVATNRLVTGMLSPLEALLFMSPLAASQCVAYAFISGEVEKIRIAYADGVFRSTMLSSGILANAIIAFVLNIVSFQTNAVAGALTMTVCGNVKQALTILFGIILFHVDVRPLNAVGMLITIAGAAYYSHVEMTQKRQKLQT